MKNNHRNGFLDPKNILLDILHDHLGDVPAKDIFFEKYLKSKMAPILAAILFFKITCMFYMIFDSFIGSGIVENIYLNTKIMTLSSLLRKLEEFLHIFSMLGGPLAAILFF